ncbi:unnamed protein product [Rhizopus microsporus]
MRNMLRSPLNKNKSEQHLLLKIVSFIVIFRIQLRLGTIGTDELWKLASVTTNLSSFAMKQTDKIYF